MKKKITSSKKKITSKKSSKVNKKKEDNSVIKKNRRHPLATQEVKEAFKKYTEESRQPVEKFAIMYTRSATTGQSGVSESIQRQVRNVIRFAHNYNFTIVGHFGGVFSHPERTEFDKMISFIKQNNISNPWVIVENCDRLSRDINVAKAMLTELKSLGIGLVDMGAFFLIFENGQLYLPNESHGGASTEDADPGQTE
jgi:hypothetical protein